MSVERDILEYLYISKSNPKYKGLKVDFLGLPDFQYYKYQTLANNFSILKKKGFITKMPNDEFIVTAKGMEFLESGKDFLKKFDTDKNENAVKDLLIVYDIEENKKKERDWFRYHLKKFHFIMIQKSVWIGPSPLPEEFNKYLDQVKLRENMKTFKLAKGYYEKHKS